VSEPPPVNCYRCGQPGHTDWVDVTRLGDAEPKYVAGEQYCLTEGCTDLDGSRRLVALTPEQLRDRANRAWMGRQERLVSER
jgi:hypothetical protein